MTAVDTNILLDILFPDPAFGPLSKEKLRAASEQGAVSICEVVYAEVAGHFPDQQTLEKFLDESNVQLTPTTAQTLWKAGHLWSRFCRERLRHSGTGRRLIADFLIGAHALLQAERLLTRDKGFYRLAFAGLRLA